MAVSHGLLAVALLAAATQRRTVLHAVPFLWVWVGLAFLLPIVLGLLPLPSAVASFVAPGRVVDAGWFMPTMDAEHTVDEAFRGLLPLGALALACVVAQHSRKDERIRRWQWGLVVALVGVAGVHIAAGSVSLFGVWPTWIAKGRWFFAPFLNPNHFAAALTMGLPVVWVTALDAEERSTRWLGGAVLLAMAGMLVATGSWGGIVGWSVASIGLLASRARKVWLVVLLLVMVSALGAALVMGEHGLGLRGRLEIWTTTIRAWPYHWLFGSGGGTFDVAVAPLRHSTEFVGWGHAHNDPLEWLLEHGLLGLAGAAVGMGILRSHFGRIHWSLWGVVGLLVHALVDFPLQLSGIAMCAAVAVGLTSSSVRGRSVLMRVALVGLAILQLAGAGWQWRTGKADEALDVLARQKGRDLAAMEALSVWAPWRRELIWAKAKLALEDDRDAARELAEKLAFEARSDPPMLRQAALLQLRLGEFEAATNTVTQCIRADPSNWQSWTTRAMVTFVHDPEAAMGAWQDAFAAGAPPRFLKVAWGSMPIGVVWLEAMEGQSPRQIQGLAMALWELGDRNTALAAFAYARESAGDAATPAEIRLLVSEGQLQSALTLAQDAATRRPDQRRRKQLAEVLDARGESEEAMLLWWSLLADGAPVLPQAILSSAAAGGPHSGLQAIRKQEALVGKAAIPVEIRLIEAKLRLENDEPRACLQILELYDIPEHARFGGRGRALRQACRLER